MSFIFGLVGWILAMIFSGFTLLYLAEHIEPKRKGNADLIETYSWYSYKPDLTLTFKQFEDFYVLNPDVYVLYRNAVGVHLVTGKIMYIGFDRENTREYQEWLINLAELRANAKEAKILDMLIENRVKIDITKVQSDSDNEIKAGLKNMYERELMLSFKDSKVAV